MKIAIIGAGNMGGATALGFARFCPLTQIIATARHQETLDKYSSQGIKTTLDNAEAVKDAKADSLDALAEEHATDYQKLMEIEARKEELNQALLLQYERWEELNG